MKANTLRVYFRNETDWSYRTALIDRETRKLLTSLDGWEPNPTYQIATKPNGQRYAVVGGTDMTGAMLRVVRKAQGYSLDELAELVGCTAQTLSYHENKRGVVTAQHLPRIYEVLRVDHRPAPMTAEVLSNVEDFLKFTGVQVAKLFGVSPNTYYGWKSGVAPGSTQGDAFYKFYCMLPDLRPDAEI